MLVFAVLSFKAGLRAARLGIGLHGLGGDKGDRISGAYKLKTDGATRFCMATVQPFFAENRTVLDWKDVS